MDNFDEETERLIEELDIEKEKEIGEDEVVPNTDDSLQESTDITDTNANDDSIDELNQEEQQEEDTGLSEEDNKTETKDNETPFESITVKSGDFDIIIDNKEDLMKYLQKGADSLSIKENTKTLENNIVDQGELSPEELTLLVDAKNGSKEAIAKLMEIAKVDQFDIEDGMKDEYQPQFKPYMENDIDKIANEIMQDSELTKQYQQITGQIDTDFVSKVQGNAELLKNFAGHVKSGLAMEIIPQAMTHRMNNGGTFFDAYSTVGQKIIANRGKGKQMEQSNQKPEMTNREKEIRSKITDQKEANHSQGKPDTAKEIWELSEEEFTELYGE